MQADPKAFRTKYRKMAADPHAFYRGSACLYYADVTAEKDPWVDEQSGAIWIHGDLHVENFGTYLNSDGRLVFDINDFDEAYIGHFTWDLQRFAASLALLGWQKALPEDDIARADPALRPRLPRAGRPLRRRGRRRGLRAAPRQHRGAGARGAGQRPQDPARRPPRRDDPRRRGRPGVHRGRHACGSCPSASGPRWRRRSRPTWRRSRAPSASTAGCSTTCATSSASRASASAAPGCRRTTCWSRATARRWTTTSSSR